MQISSITSPRNQILSSLPYKEFDRLKPELKKIKVSHGDILYRPNEPVKFVYFPEDCIVSTITVFDDGTSIENGIVGNEGLLGVAPALSTMKSPREATVQSNGECLRISTDVFRQAFEDNSTLRQLALSYIFAFFEQVAQSGACNKHHTVNQRIARWLLTLRDRTENNQLMITQDSMAQMLGVHRPGITLAAIQLKNAGLINYRRGSVTIEDREGLEEVSCECYRLIKKVYEQYVSILELQALNRKLEEANQKLDTVIKHRRTIQSTTHERVHHLRKVVSDINKGRKSELICARCHRISENDRDWAKTQQPRVEALLKNSTPRVVCPDCESLFGSETPDLKPKANGRRA
ncbi:MAG: Crp/Fnr family transcriptional regulator [Acidobacteriota bacterium]|nr:Crp/Fnr family transcriptional regulator [Acidobacteriota bacterium]